ncbi:MAG: right-handed parallel beta-helix repeat-containing protein, partial [Candidatus Thorarchaeota archaeon]
MKHARKALIFLILLVTPLLLAGVLSPAIDNEVEATISPFTTKVNVPSYEEQTPILAYNDFDMDNYASDLSWTGDGSSGTPYIIEGYNITSDSDSILIHDTTRAFEIRNCLITSYSSGSGNGIMINNATQVAIVDTFVMDKSDTIDVRNVPSLYIENCTVSGGGSSVYIHNCTGTTITSCNIYDNFSNGIYLDECNSSMITNNVING